MEGPWPANMKVTWRVESMSCSWPSKDNGFRQVLERLHFYSAFPLSLLENCNLHPGPNLEDAVILMVKLCEGILFASREDLVLLIGGFKSSFA